MFRVYGIFLICVWSVVMAINITLETIRPSAGEGWTFLLTWQRFEIHK